MKCPPVFFAELKRRWPSDLLADTHISRQIKEGVCRIAWHTKPTPSTDATKQQPWSGLPMTQRAMKWQAVRHLDENAARRRAVIEANRKALEKTLGKGACSDD
jgi:hypothetical protein